MEDLDRYVTVVRRYSTDGEFLSTLPVTHLSLEEAVRDARDCLTIPFLRDPIAYKKRDGTVVTNNPVMPTNISVRDMKTGRFVKWSNL